MVLNKSVIMLKRPEEYPIPGEHFGLQESEFKPVLKNGDIATRNLALSLDPYMRPRMDAEKSYIDCFKIGEPLIAGGVAEVIESQNPRFPVGTIIEGYVGWELYTHLTEANIQDHRILHGARESSIPLSSYLGVLGMPGMTAYSSLIEVGAPKAGETIFISAAAGAVGQLVGQMAKRLGLRVVGSVGSDEKVEFLLKDLHFDAAFNYKRGNILENLRKAVPEGIDIYYENVGGEQLEAVLEQMNDHGRIVACGMISQYNTKNAYGVRNLLQVVIKRIRFEGFLVEELYAKYGEQFDKEVGSWFANKEIKYVEDVAHGIENAMDAFVGMLKGKNFGKQVVKIADL
ncbi:hypothetical protein DFQ26_007909 [Actinomortierella ambigua]|nr:hypothetical protein DFQ26_007909 [Actinomortierella ambigua]